MENRLLLENEISVKYCTSGTKEYPQNDSISVVKLPFELFISVHSGAVTYISSGKMTRVTEGETVLVPLDSEYSLNIDEGSRLSYVAGAFNIYTNLRMLYLFDLPLKISGDDGKEICRLSLDVAKLSISNEFTTMRLENAVKVKNAMTTIFSIALDHSVFSNQRWELMSSYEKISPVLRYIDDHLHEQILQEQLSSMMKMSPDSFYRLFKKLTGYAPKEYIISERIKAAREMLVFSPMSIGEISELAGYDNQLYFSTLFRKKYLMAPTEYRKAVARII